MKKKAGLVIVILILALASFVAYRIINTPKTGDTVASFSSCGCGVCGGSAHAPLVENIKNTSQGRAKFNQLKKELGEPPSEEACMAVGCAFRCTEYRLIAV